MSLQDIRIGDELADLVRGYENASVTPLFASHRRSNDNHLQVMVVICHSSSIRPDEIDNSHDENFNGASVNYDLRCMVGLLP